MCTQCPVCREWLESAGHPLGTRLLCPFCQSVFPLAVQLPARQLLVAVDVSTSASRFLPQMQRQLALLLAETRRAEPVNMCTYLFHRRVMPFPCEQWCFPCPEGRAVVPTLGDLRAHTGGGSAILDALYRLLIQAQKSAPVPSELVLLTDGREHRSRRHPVEVRRKLEQVASCTSIRVLVFANTVCGRQPLQFMHRLAILNILWSLHLDNNDGPVSAFPHCRSSIKAASETPTPFSNPNRRGIRTHVQ